MAKRRIGIFGGTFDPVHNGHIQMAQSVLDAGLVDELFLVPAGSPPHKTCVADAEDRWRMLVSACASDRRLVPSSLEMDRKGISFAADTLESARKKHPKADLVYIIGADSLMNLHRWKRLETVLSACSFLVIPRPDAVDQSALAKEIARLSGMGGHLSVFPKVPVAVSSVEVRSALAAGKVPSSLGIPVYEYCRTLGLYGTPGRIRQADRWISSLFEALNPHRFAHSLSVAFTARRLAMIHGINPLQAEQAGLLHDCAKCFSLKEMQRVALKNSLDVDEEMLSSGALLHSVVGARIAQDRYGMTDPEVLEAIAWHNTGHAGMSRLAMCVCLSDSIEPLRESYPLLEQIRSLAEHSLEQALLLSLESTAEYVCSRGKYLHPRTQETISWLKMLISDRGLSDNLPDTVE